MIKFLFFFIFILPLGSLGKICFWYIGSFLIIWLLIVLVINLMELDRIFLRLNIYIDILSFSLIVLRVWVSILIYFSSQGIFKRGSSYFYFYVCVYLLCLTLILTFSSLNLLSFYFYFEASLIPTILIILGWGYQPERLQAGLYFLFYTLTASLPLLLSLVYLF